MQILKRRSYKDAFDNKAEISLDTLEKLKLAQIPGASVHTDKSRDFVASMCKQTMQAMSIEMITERTYMQSARLMRIGTDEIKANPDGISLNSHLMVALRKIGVVTKENLIVMTSNVYTQEIEDVIQTLSYIKGHVWIKTQGNNRIEQINAGRSYLRVNLQATKLG